VPTAYGAASEALVAEFDSAHLALKEICVQFECL
jgi:hypothetical protein